MLYTYFPCWKLPLCSVDIVFGARILQISCSQIRNFFVIVVAYRLVSHPRIDMQIQFREDFALCFHSKSCMVLGLAFRSLRRSELGLHVLVKDPTLSFARDYTVLLLSFAENTVFSPMNDFDILIENQLTIYVRFYSWSLYSLPFFYVLVFMPVLHSFDSCDFRVSFEVIRCESFKFVYFFKYYFG